jgi:hypothetical protein
MKKSTFWIVNVIWAILFTLVAIDDYQTNKSFDDLLEQDKRNFFKRMIAEDRIMTWHDRGLIPHDEYRKYDDETNSYDKH